MRRPLVPGESVGVEQPSPARVCGCHLPLLHSTPPLVFPTPPLRRALPLVTDGRQVAESQSPRGSVTLC
ncbi:hypothetical protein E2C01_069758 [Portunus trituberculatus]|uniref:Uncharacterized protein n=1 Tax=Portunus trituberculatus TaxID=210409 RepID=A0A5B7HVF0_PORTR|nr:hypothetical protein [Portunus trituberculatus]